MVKKIKTAMLREEERIRAKTAQAMALKTQWKQRQIFSAVELTADADTETVLKPLRYEIQALVAQANRLNSEMWTQAERAILQERAAFANAFSNPSLMSCDFLPIPVSDTLRIRFPKGRV